MPARRIHLNVGGLDRVLRLLFGTAFLAVGLFADVTLGWRIASFVLAAIGLGTALLRYCPVNHALGVDTRPGRGRALSDRTA